MPDGERKEILLTIPDATAWLHLGTFQLSPGKYDLRLYDNDNPDTQLIYADAIKWVGCR